MQKRSMLSRYSAFGGFHVRERTESGMEPTQVLIRRHLMMALIVLRIILLLILILKHLGYL